MPDMRKYPLPVERLQLVGGFADGRTVTLYGGQPRPRRYHVEVPFQPSVHTYGEGELTYQEVLGSFDAYAPDLDESHHQRRNDRGELLYRLAESYRHGNRVELPLTQPDA